MSPFRKKHQHTNSMSSAGKNEMKPSGLSIDADKFESQITRASRVSRISTIGISDNNTSLFDFDFMVNNDVESAFSNSQVSSPIVVGKFH